VEAPGDRLHALDALRAFALILGIFFHGAAGYIENFPVALWPMREPPSTTLAAFFFVSHMFRMSLFFVLAGFFGRMMVERRGTRGFVRDRAKRILVPLVVGLPLVLASIAAGAALGSVLGGMDLATLQAATQPVSVPEGQPAPFPWAHLWFLYYLSLFYVMALGARAVTRRLDEAGRAAAMLDAVVRTVLSGVWGAALVGLPLAAYFYTLEGWESWVGLPAPLVFWPSPPSLVAYGTAFAVGWLAHRQTARLLALAQRWQPFAALAVLLTVVSYVIGGPTPRFEAYLGGRPLLLFTTAYMVAVWCWIFALIGLAVRYLSTVSPARRYLADASYWMYLMHLSVLAFFAVWLQPLDWDWTIKYPLQVAGTIVVLLVSYRYLVRPTVIGAILNGRRYPRQGGRPADVVGAR
jgi:glucan biosynthesis protein C